MNHEEIRTFLQNQNRLDPMPVEVCTHLSGCADCQAFANTLSDLRSGEWSPYMKQPLSHTETRDLVQSLLPQIRTRNYMQQQIRPSRSKLPTFVGAFAMIAILLMGSFLWLTNTTSTPVWLNNPFEKIDIPVVQQVTEPKIVVPFAKIGIWSLDSKYYAFWTSNEDDLATAPENYQPQERLQIYDINKSKLCSTEITQEPLEYNQFPPPDIYKLIWQDNGTLRVQRGADAWEGRPCKTFRTVEFKEQENRLFNLGIYSGEFYGGKCTNTEGCPSIKTEMLEITDNQVTVKISMLDRQAQLIHSINYTNNRLFGVDLDELGENQGYWVSPTQFFVRETNEYGPLLIDEENGVIEVIPDLFKFTTLDERRIQIYWTSQSDQTNQYHLLADELVSGDSRNESKRRAWLYHAETGQVESLPDASGTSQHFITEGYITLTPHSSEFGEDVAIRRPLDGNTNWEVYGPSAASRTFTVRKNQIVYSEDWKRVIVQDWTTGEIINQFEFDHSEDFISVLAVPSPDNKYIALSPLYLDSDVDEIFILPLSR